MGFRRVWVAELEGGTLTSSAGDLVSLLVRPSLVSSDAGVGVEGGGVGELVVGTLLGPEGTGQHLSPGGGCFFWRASCSSYRSCRLFGVGCGVWRPVVWGDFPYFENCTVDASI
jgi:hypothetical protein